MKSCLSFIQKKKTDSEFLFGEKYQKLRKQENSLKLRWVFFLQVITIPMCHPVLERIHKMLGNYKPFRKLQVIHIQTALLPKKSN